MPVSCIGESGSLSSVVFWVGLSTAPMSSSLKLVRLKPSRKRRALFLPDKSMQPGHTRCCHHLKPRQHDADPRAARLQANEQAFVYFFIWTYYNGYNVWVCFQTGLRLNHPRYQLSNSTADLAETLRDVNWRLDRGPSRKTSYFLVDRGSMAYGDGTGSGHRSASRWPRTPVSGQ